MDESQDSRSLREQHTIRPGEIVIEIDNEHTDVKTSDIVDDYEPFNPMKIKTVRKETRAGNRHQNFPPVGDRKNGINYIRTRRVLVRDGLDARLHRDPALIDIDYIPGERIHLDMTRKVGRITDAIFDLENDELYHQLIEVAKNLHGPRMFLRPSEFVDQDLSDPHAFWGWAYWMRRIMDGDAEHGSGPERHKGCAVSGPRFCRPVQNVEKMPTMKEIAASCKVLLPRIPYGKIEQEKEWDERRKAEDPDYVRQDGNRTVLTPWLAGFGPSKMELATAE